MDCCGLMFECYDRAGIDIRFIDRVDGYTGTWWQTSSQQILVDPLRRVMDVTFTTMLPLSPEPGSWILYAYDGRMVAHMALHVGNGEIIHTFRERIGCVKQALSHRYWAEKVVGFATLKEEFFK